MRLVLATALLALPPLAAGQALRQEIEFTQASQLMPWCESEARAHFAGSGVTTYQWTSRYFDRGNLLMVEGRIRADGKDFPVTCSVARGGRERYAVMRVGDAS